MNPLLQMMQAVQASAWMIQPSRLEEMKGILQMCAQGSLSLEDIRKGTQANHEMHAARVTAVSGASGGAVALIPVYGTVMQRGSLFSYYFGGASTEAIGEQVRVAAADPKVRAIVLDVDSPGGTVSGVQELFDTIYAVRGKKDVIAVSDSLMASAAYYLSAAAKQIYAAPSSLTGSIGVYTTHFDYSEMLAEMGIKVTLVQYGANKTAGNPYKPYTAEDEAKTQAMVDAFGNAFDAACAKGRDITKAQVKAKFGQGDIFTADAAKAAGMVDKIGTIDDVLAKYGVSRFSSTSFVNMEGTSLPVASAGDTPIAEDTSDCPREDCPAQADGIGDSDDCPATDCPLRDGDDSEAKAACQRAHAHRARLIQIATL